MLYVTRHAHFNAAHRLHNSDYSDEWNQQTYGRCNHPNWHGHNYRLEVVVAGEKPDPETGYVIDLGKLQEIIDTEIVEPCDHRNLNLDVPFLEGVIPTSENLVRVFYQRLKDPVQKESAEGAFLYSVKLYETDRNAAEYRYLPEDRK